MISSGACDVDQIYMSGVSNDFGWSFEARE